MHCVAALFRVTVRSCCRSLDSASRRRRAAQFWVVGPAGKPSYPIKYSVYKNIEAKKIVG